MALLEEVDSELSKPCAISSTYSLFYMLVVELPALAAMLFVSMPPWRLVKG